MTHVADAGDQRPNIALQFFRPLQIHVCTLSLPQHARLCAFAFPLRRASKKQSE